MKSAYVVGDIHGEKDRLIFLLDAIEQHIIDNKVQDAELIFVGDYIDRGPDSAGVLSEIMRLIERPGVFTKVTALKGNHEDMMVRGQYNRQYEGMWYMNGGLEAASSFVGKPITYAELTDYVDVRAVVGTTFYNFCRDLPEWYQTGHVCVAHAGIDDPEALANDHSSDELLWSRRLRVTPHNHYKLTVHGHTPMKRPMFGNGVAYIDTGAVFDENQPLTALFIPDVVNPNMDSLQLVTDNGVDLYPTRV